MLLMIFEGFWELILLSQVRHWGCFRKDWEGLGCLGGEEASWFCLYWDGGAPLSDISNINRQQETKMSNWHLSKISILMWLLTGQAGRWGRLQGAWWNQDLWEQSQGGVNLRLDLLVFHCQKNAETWICLQNIQKVKVYYSLARSRWAEEGEMVLEDVAEAEGEAGLFS